MASDILGQILGSVLGNVGASRAGPPGNPSGGLADVFGDLLGGGAGAQGRPSGGGSPFSGKGGALIAMLLPLAMQWVQRNGGVSEVLKRFQDKGYSQQAASWVSTGANETLSREAVGEVVGLDELSRLSRQLGVGNDEVSEGMAQILPEVVNQLTPDGSMQGDPDEVLGQGITALEQFLARLQAR